MWVAAQRAARSTSWGVPKTRSKWSAWVGVALFEGGEDAAAVVVHHDDAQVGARFGGADDQAVGVVQEGQIANQRVRRARVGEGGSDGGGDGAVDAGQAAVRDCADRYYGRQVQVAYRVRRRNDEHPVGAGALTHDRGDRRTGEPVGQHLVDRRPGELIRLQPAGPANRSDPCRSPRAR